MKTVNISLVGVGGQGILLTSDVLAKAAALAGFDVKKSEIHGMAQRGGSVISQVRFGTKVYSPIVEDGSSDVLVAFDRLESLRWRHLLAPDGNILIAKTDLTPVTVSSGLQKALTDMDARLAAEYPDAIYVEAEKIAAGLGNTRAMNIVVAGALSKLMPFKESIWLQALKERVPAKFLELNLKAFAEGRKLVKGSEE